MLYLKSNQSNDIVVTWSERATTTSAPYYLLEVEHIATRNKQIIVVAKSSNLSVYSRYDKFAITTQFSQTGQYLYTAYEATDTAFNTVVAVVETGLIYVQMLEENYDSALNNIQYVQVNNTCSPVVISPVSGEYDNRIPLAVTMETTTPLAEIRYTLDGSQPTESSLLYSPASKPEITSSTTIRAKAFKNRFLPSTTTTNVYSLVVLDVRNYVRATNQESNQTLVDALDLFVTELKDEGIWDKIYALYPFYGTSSNQHKFNLKSPIDSDLAFRMQWNGGWIFQNNGAKPNGIDAWGNTFFKIDQSNLPNGLCFGVFAAAPLVGDSFTWMMASQLGTGIQSRFGITNRTLDLFNRPAFVYNTTNISEGGLELGFQAISANNPNFGGTGIARWIKGSQTGTFLANAPVLTNDFYVGATSSANGATAFGSILLQMAFTAQFLTFEELDALRIASINLNNAIR